MHFNIYHSLFMCMLFYTLFSSLFFFFFVGCCLSVSVSNVLTQTVGIYFI